MAIDQIWVEALGIATKVDLGLDITSLVTNDCWDCTARDAFQYGYKAIIASDPTAAMTDDEHNAALLNLEIYYACVASSDTIVEALG